MIMGKPGFQAHPVGTATPECEHRATLDIQRTAHKRMIGLGAETPAEQLDFGPAHHDQGRVAPFDRRD